jgi:hypothetical protein
MVGSECVSLVEKKFGKLSLPATLFGPTMSLDAGPIGDLTIDS